MKVLNLGVHVASALVLIVMGILLLISGLLVSGISAIFNGNFFGVIMMLLAALFIGIGVATLRVCFANSALIEVDKETYLAKELKLAFWAVAMASAALFVLLAFNSFNVQDVFSYGYGVFFVVLSAVIGLNLLAYVLTMLLVH